VFSGDDGGEDIQLGKFDAKGLGHQCAIIFVLF
jgi:hypothetical protein